MKRSEINQLVSDATACFQRNGWILPPNPKWDVTDFGLGDWKSYGLVLVNLADQPEYCEKLMYAKSGMTTPAHCHRSKKEDIIARNGVLRVQLWADVPDESAGKPVSVLVNGEPKSIDSGAFVDLHSGWRVTITPGVFHEFVPLSEECVIGEVSTANDDLHDNYFIDAMVGRYPEVTEDATPIVRLLSDA
ncbi:MAG: D-lyxose/D-mannose family sugar isomerase [Fimbriimonas sp.]|nr:D-lyxose/D-mannose family sugar isomerase [Fimbriimonas sp.]